MGKLTLSDGSCYKGLFCNNQINGYGKYTWKNHSVYLGQFKNNKMEGEGTFKFPDGGCYKGNFENNEQNGLENSHGRMEKYIGDYGRMGKEMNLEKYIMRCLKNGKKDCGIKGN